MADHNQKNPNATQSGNAPSGSDKSNPTSQGGQPNEMPDRGKSDGSQDGARKDGQPSDPTGSKTSTPESMKNEGGAQSSSSMQNKGMGEDEKGSAERETPETDRR